MAKIVLSANDVVKRSFSYWHNDTPDSVILAQAVTCHANQAIRLRARKETVDREGNERVTGEEWLHRKTGAYMPGPYEEFLEIVNAYVLTEKKALHMKCELFGWAASRG